MTTSDQPNENFPFPEKPWPDPEVDATMPHEPNPDEFATKRAEQLAAERRQPEVGSVLYAWQMRVASGWNIIGLQMGDASLPLVTTSMRASKASARSMSRSKSAASGSPPEVVSTTFVAVGKSDCATCSSTSRPRRCRPCPRLRGHITQRRLQRSV